MGAQRGRKQAVFLDVCLPSFIIYPAIARTAGSPVIVRNRRVSVGATNCDSGLWAEVLEAVKGNIIFPQNAQMEHRKPRKQTKNTT